jgi:hypothetical protein
MRGIRLVDYIRLRRSVRCPEMPHADFTPSAIAAFRRELSVRMKFAPQTVLAPVDVRTLCHNRTCFGVLNEESMPNPPGAVLRHDACIPKLNRSGLMWNLGEVEDFAHRAG